MPRKKEESDEEESEEESEEEESGSDDSDDEGSEEDSDDEEDSDGSEEESDDSEEEDETPRSSKKNISDGLLNISLTIDKENGKVISSKVEEKRKENPPTVDTSTAMTQTDYNMFFPPLSEALYQASTNVQRKDELISQAKRVLLAPETTWRNTMNSPQPSQTYHQPIYKPVSSPYPQMFEQQSMRPSRIQDNYPPSRDPYSYSASSSYRPIPQNNNFYDQQPHYKHYPPPPRNYQPQEYSNVRFQTESTRHYYDKNTPSFKPINDLDSATSNSPTPSFSEDNRYGRYINPKFM